MPLVVSSGSKLHGWTPPQVFETTFAGTEDPLSESSAWLQQNVYYKKVLSDGGHAYGKQPNPANTDVYEDAYAYLAAEWPADHYASGHIKKGTVGGNMEFELLLRWSDTANSTDGYEVGIHAGGSYWFVNKPAGTALSAAATIAYYTEIRAGSEGGFTTPNDNDLFEAQIIGDEIKVWVAGALLGTVDVSLHPVTAGGRPGIGFFTGNSGGETANTNVAFYDFSARGL